jgi:8-amino-7-oxononanoate synthase
MLSGASSEHTDFGGYLANHMGSQEALLFSTGWEGNVAFFATVPQPQDYIIYDALMHASFFAGLAISAVPPKRRIRMAHNNPKSLAKILRTITADGALSPDKGRKPTVFLVIETIYSMDGDFAPIPAFIDTMDMYVPKAQQCNFVDEAHSTAMYGEGGRGICWALGPKYRNRIHVRLMTFGKAIGASGSALFMSSMVKFWMINESVSFIFSTAPAHYVLVAAKTAWDVVSGPQGDIRREAMIDNSVYFNEVVDRVLAVAPPSVFKRPEHDGPPPFPAEAGTMLPPRPVSAVIAICTPDPDAAYDFCLDRGFIVSSIPPPAVPVGQERIRICLRSDMDKAQLDRLGEILLEYVERQTGEAIEYRAKL